MGYVIYVPYVHDIGDDYVRRWWVCLGSVLGVVL